MPAKWNAITSNFDLVNNISGLVNGPGISTDNAIVRFDGTTGTIVQNSGSTLSDTNVLTTGELNLTTDLAVTYGGTGASSFSSGGLLLGNGAGALTDTGVLAKGSILVGDGAGAPTELPVGADDEVLTADSSLASGVKWAPGSGGGGVITFTDITPQTLVVDNGYFATAIGTYDMPATAAQGDFIIVICDAAAGVILDLPAANFIRIGLSITADGGTITSTAIGDSVTFRYRIATKTWHTTAVTGNWTI